MHMTFFRALPVACLAALACATLPATAQMAEINSGHLAMLDADGDGAISKPEFDTFSNFAFDQMDTNDNGMISASEYGQALPADGFGDLDLDNSGDLSQDEFNMQMSKDFAAADRDGNGLLD